MSDANLELVSYYYIAFLGRAPDPAGFEFYNRLLSADPDDTTAVMMSIASSNECAGFLPFLDDASRTDDASSGAFVEQLYQNLFGRSADAAGMEFWSSLIDSGQLDAIEAVELIISSARDDPEAGTLDQTAFQNKIEAGAYWIDKVSSIEEYSFDADAMNNAKEAVSPVTSDPTTLESSKVQTEAYMTRVAGSEISFTEAEGEEVVGTAYDDTFFGDVSFFASEGTEGTQTFDASDKVIGGEGHDTLYLSAKGAGVRLHDSLNIEGIETLVLTADSYWTEHWGRIDLALAPGVTTLIQENTWRPGGVRNITDEHTLVYNPSGLWNTATVLASGNSTLNIELGAGSVNFFASETTAGDLKTFNLSGVGGAAFGINMDYEFVHFDAATAEETVNLSLSAGGTLEHGTLVSSTLTTLDASGSTGSLTLQLDGTSPMLDRVVLGEAGDNVSLLKSNGGSAVTTIVGGHGDDTIVDLSYGTLTDVQGGRGADIIILGDPEADVTISGDEGNDAITVGAALGHVTIDGGRGNDVIDVSQLREGSTTSLTGGYGRDVFVLSDNSDDSLFFELGSWNDRVDSFQSGSDVLQFRVEEGTEARMSTGHVVDDYQEAAAAARIAFTETEDNIYVASNGSLTFFFFDPNDDAYADYELSLVGDVDLAVSDIEFI